MLFKIRVLELVDRRRQQRIDLKKQLLQIMQENPELRDVLTDELKNLRHEEEEDTKMIALEFQKNPQPAVEGSNQSVGPQITN